MAQVKFNKKTSSYVVIDDNGTELKCRRDDYRAELILPPNASGRTRIKRHLVDDAPGQCLTLEAPRKTWLDYLTPDEKATLEKIRNAAEARMPKPAKPTELQRAQAALAKAQERLNKLLGL